MIEPAIERAVAFIDGQNLFHHVRDAFGYYYPNYDIRKLVASVAAQEKWDLVATYFYTGVPMLQMILAGTAFGQISWPPWADRA